MPHHFHKHHHGRYEWWILALIMLIAFVFRFQHILIDGNPTSALFGLLTVLGLYFLARKLFNWEIAAMASVLMAVSGWHTVFSRSGDRTVLALLLLVWGLYVFWRAKTSVKWFDFGLSGLLLGIGFYFSSTYYIVPVFVVATLLAYWHAVHKDFDGEKYAHAKHHLLRGFALLMLVALFIVTPLGWRYMIHPTRISLTFGFMHIRQIALFWPVGLLFIIGLLRSFIKLFKSHRTHGHYATVQVLLISWLFLGIVADSLLIAPVLFILAGEGLWWLYDFCRKWYGLYDQHPVVIHEHVGRENKVVATLALWILLVSIMISEYHALFNVFLKR